MPADVYAQLEHAMRAGRPVRLLARIAGRVVSGQVRITGLSDTHVHVAVAHTGAVHVLPLSEVISLDESDPGTDRPDAPA